MILNIYDDKTGTLWKIKNDNKDTIVTILNKISNKNRKYIYGYCDSIGERVNQVYAAEYCNSTVVLYSMDKNRILIKFSDEIIYRCIGWNILRNNFKYVYGKSVDLKNALDILNSGTTSIENLISYRGDLKEVLLNIEKVFDKFTYKKFSDGVKVIMKLIEDTDTVNFYQHCYILSALREHLKCRMNSNDYSNICNMLNNIWNSLKSQNEIDSLSTALYHGNRNALEAFISDENNVVFVNIICFMIKSLKPC